jgi:hypothetical protein
LHISLPAGELDELVFVGRLRPKLVPNFAACFRMLPEPKYRFRAQLWRVDLPGLAGHLRRGQRQRLIKRGGGIVPAAAQRQKQFDENPDRYSPAVIAEIRHDDLSSSRPKWASAGAKL